MGWNKVESSGSYDSIKPLESETLDRFYFVHSFHPVNFPSDNQILHCFHGYRFTCGIQHDRIIGVQFHPEKSHRHGKLF
jgi:glutamine amidotransferase